jgi:hypothetical protein
MFSENSWPKYGEVYSGSFQKVGSIDRFDRFQWDMTQRFQLAGLRRKQGYRLFLWHIRDLVMEVTMCFDIWNHLPGSLYSLFKERVSKRPRQCQKSPDQPYQNILPSDTIKKTNHIPNTKLYFGTISTCWIEFWELKCKWAGVWSTFLVY